MSAMRLASAPCLHGSPSSPCNSSGGVLSDHTFARSPSPKAPARPRRCRQSGIRFPLLFVSVGLIARCRRRHRGRPAQGHCRPLPRYLHQDHVHRRAGHRHGLRFPQPGEPARLECSGTHHSRKRGPDIDMYPLYWTPSRGGIIMRYTYEYKRKCVELYREGKWPETPEGVSDKSFRDKVRLWVRAEDSRGPEALKHKNFNRNWTPEERLELVSQVMSGKSCVSVAIEAGIQDRLLYQWVQNYKTKGYNGLVEMKKGRPSKGVPQMKKEEARPLNESEREELIRLRAENEYIKAENEVIKKELALREERHAAQLKARKQRSSKSCVKKDTN